MIDDFDLLPRDEAFDPFSVVLFKALQVLAFLFFIALLIVAPKAKEGKVDSKAEFLITVDWPDNHPDDIDTFVQDPLGNVAWFRRREAGFMVLDRDDRGGINDFVMVNGTKVRTATRQELVSIRGIVAGEYTVNVYHFTALTGEAVPVTVTVQKLNPIAKIIAKETVELEKGSTEERTAVRFTLDAKGEVTATSHIQRSILQTFHSAWRNGAP
jgi:paraquat-inducible protein B